MDLAAVFLDKTVLVNLWMIDGFKADPVDIDSPRHRMFDSLCEIMRYASKNCPNVAIAVEFKLFAPETAEYVVVSLEWLVANAKRLGYTITLDLGHSWPGRDWADLASSLAATEIPLAVHVSRGVYGDDDLTVTFDTKLYRFFRQLKRSGIAECTWVGLDTFDSRINPLHALYVSAQSVRAAQVLAELDPQTTLQLAENEVNEGMKLFIQEVGQFLTSGLIMARARQLHDLPPLDEVFEISQK